MLNKKLILSIIFTLVVSLLFIGCSKATAEKKDVEKTEVKSEECDSNCKGEHNCDEEQEVVENHAKCEHGDHEHDKDGHHDHEKCEHNNYEHNKGDHEDCKCEHESHEHEGENHNHDHDGHEHSQDCKQSKDCKSAK